MRYILMFALPCMPVVSAEVQSLPVKSFSPVRTPIPYACIYLNGRSYGVADSLEMLSGFLIFLKSGDAFSTGYLGKPGDILLFTGNLRWAGHGELLQPGTCRTGDVEVKPGGEERRSVP